MTTMQEHNRRATLRRRDEAAEREVAIGRHWSGRPTVVYFIERDGLVKIGTTTQLPQRLRALRGRLLATEPGAHNRESQIHERFDRLRVVGEWFRPERELLDYIGTLNGSPS